MSRCVVAVRLDAWIDHNAVVEAVSPTPTAMAFGTLRERFAAYFSTHSKLREWIDRLGRSVTIHIRTPLVICQSCSAWAWLAMHSHKTRLRACVTPLRYPLTRQKLALLMPALRFPGPFLWVPPDAFETPVLVRRRSFEGPS